MTEEDVDSGCENIEVSRLGGVYVAQGPGEATAPGPMAEPEKLTLSADELFDFDKAVLRPVGKQALDELVSKLKGYNHDTIVAVGYTDRLEADKQKLSLRPRRL